MNTILQLHSKVVTSVILITSIVGLLISIYDPLVPYSESNNTPGRTVTWIDYTGNKYDSGVKITATFSGVVSADAKYLGQEVLVNGPYTQTATATIP